MTRLYLALAVLTMIAASGVVGYTRGVSAANTKHALAVAEAQRDAIRAAELASRKEEERLRLEAERASLAQQLEDQANAEPPSGTCDLPVSRVRRIELR